MMVKSYLSRSCDNLRTFLKTDESLGLWRYPTRGQHYVNIDILSSRGAVSLDDQNWRELISEPQRNNENDYEPVSRVSSPHSYVREYVPIESVSTLTSSLDSDGRESRRKSGSVPKELRYGTSIHGQRRGASKLLRSLKRFKQKLMSSTKKLDEPQTESLTSKDDRKGENGTTTRIPKHAGLLNKFLSQVTDEELGNEFDDNLLRGSVRHAKGLSPKPTISENNTLGAALQRNSEYQHSVTRNYPDIIESHHDPSRNLMRQNKGPERYLQQSQPSSTPTEINQGRRCKLKRQTAIRLPSSDKTAKSNTRLPDMHSFREQIYSQSSSPNTSVSVSRPSSDTNHSGPLPIEPIYYSTSASNIPLSPHKDTFSSANRALSSNSMEMSSRCRAISPTSREMPRSNRSISPTSRCLSPTNRKIWATIRALSPTSRALSPTNRTLCPASTALPPDSRALSPTSRAVSPTSTALPPTSRALSPDSRALSPTSRAVSPINRALSPTNRALSPTSKALSPARRAMSPMNSTIYPTNRAISPTNRPASPINRAKSPYNRELSVSNMSKSHFDEELLPSGYHFSRNQLSAYECLFSKTNTPVSRTASPCCTQASLRTMSTWTASYPSGEVANRALSPQCGTKSPRNFMSSSKEISSNKDVSPVRRGTSEKKYRTKTVSVKTNSPAHCSLSPNTQEISDLWRSRGYWSEPKRQRAKSPGNEFDSSGNISESRLGSTTFPTYRSVSPSRRQTSPTCRSVSPSRRQKSPTYRSVSPSRRQRSATCRSVSPSRRQISPTYRSVSPSRRQRSATCRSVSPSRRQRSPTYRSVSPSRRQRSATCRSVSPSRRQRSPSYRSVSPSRRQRSPSYKSVSPSRRQTSPTYRSVSPSRRQTSPTYRSVSPSRRQKSPTYRSVFPYRRQISPTYRSVSPSNRARYCDNYDSASDSTVRNHDPRYHRASSGRGAVHTPHRDSVHTSFKDSHKEHLDERRSSVLGDRNQHCRDITFCSTEDPPGYHDSIVRNSLPKGWRSNENHHLSTELGITAKSGNYHDGIIIEETTLPQNDQQEIFVFDSSPRTKHSRSYSLSNGFHMKPSTEPSSCPEAAPTLTHSRPTPCESEQPSDHPRPVASETEPTPSSVMQRNRDHVASYKNCSSAEAPSCSFGRGFQLVQGTNAREAMSKSSEARHSSPHLNRKHTLNLSVNAVANEILV